jgi:hypothetical protein
VRPGDGAFPPSLHPERLSRASGPSRAEKPRNAPPGAKVPNQDFCGIIVPFESSGHLGGMKAKVTQGEFKQLNWGGKRKGAGRKPEGARRVSHARRPEFPARYPLLVTVRFIEGLPSLRDFATLEVFAQVVRGVNRREDFRIVEFSLQSNHAHLIVEAEGRVALSRAMNGFGRSLVHGLQVSLELRATCTPTATTLGRSGRPPRFATVSATR